MGRALRHQEDAASSAIAFIVAGVLFVTAVALVIYVTNNKVAADPARADISGNGVSADSVLDLFLSPGTEAHWDGAAWDPDLDDDGDMDGSFRPSIVDADGLLAQERLTSFVALDDEDVRAAFNLTAAASDQVPLTYSLTVQVLETGTAMPGDLDGYNVTDGSAVPSASGAAVQSASMIVRIDQEGLATALVTVQVFASTSA